MSVRCHCRQRTFSELPPDVFRNPPYATFACRRPIKMSLLCQLEMTLPGGSAELAYEPSVLGQTTGAASWAGASGGGRALRYAGAPRPPAARP